MILGWIDFILNYICKPLSKGCLLFIIPSILFMPVTLLYNLGCTSIIFLKNRILGNYITFKEAQIVFQSRFPIL